MNTIKNRVKNSFRRGYLALATIGGVMSTVAVRATDTSPLDLSSTGSTIAGYVAGAAAAGAVIMAAIWGVRICVKAFKAVGK